MLLSGSGGAIFFVYLWSMLDVQPGASEMGDSAAAPDTTKLNTSHLETRRSAAQRRKGGGSMSSEEGSWSQDDDHGIGTHSLCTTGNLSNHELSMHGCYWDPCPPRCNIYASRAPASEVIIPLRDVKFDKESILIQITLFLLFSPFVEGVVIVLCDQTTS